MMDTGIATRLRHAFTAYPVKVKVREVHEWKTRTTGNPFNPKGAVNHHTAGHPTENSPAPSLGIVTNGRPDLSGPLCNVLFAPLNLTFYVVAAGACNHAGPPDVSPFHGMQFNGDAYSIEVEHDGVHPLPGRFIPILARGWAAILQKGDIPASQLFQHWEWAPSRKTDLGTNCHPNTNPTEGEFRQLVKAQKEKLENPWAVRAPERAGEVLKVGKLDELLEWQKDHKLKIRDIGGSNLRRNI